MCIDCWSDHTYKYKNFKTKLKKFNSMYKYSSQGRNKNINKVVFNNTEESSHLLNKNKKIFIQWKIHAI